MLNKNDFVLVNLNSKGAIESVSEQFTKAFGYSLKEVKGRYFESLATFVAPTTVSFSAPEYGKLYFIEIITSWGDTIFCTLIAIKKEEHALNPHPFLISFLEPPNPYPYLSTDNIFKQIFENVAVGVALVNTKGLILRANHTFQSFLEYSEPELQQMTFPEFTHSEDVNKDLEYYKQLLANEIQSYQMEKRYITKSGTVVWVHLSVSLMRREDNSVKHAVAIVKNIDERKRMELELKESKSRLERAFTGAREAVWHWMDVNTEEVWWSPSFNEILGYDETELRPGVTSFYNILHPDDHKKLDHALKLHFELKEPFDVVYRVKTKAGVYKWINAKGVAEIDENGETNSMIGIFADLDQIKEAEMLLTEKYLALEQSNKELENFAYIASHDLQEPLRTISSFLQLFKLSIKNPVGKEAEEYLEIVLQASLRMRKLVEDLLEYSKVKAEGDEPEVIQMDVLIKEVISDFTTQIKEKEAEVLVRHPLPVFGDRTKVYRLFNNLLSNALKFSRTGEKPIVTIEAAKVGSRVEYSFSDNGIGIDKNYHSVVFDIFKRLHSKDKYTGSGIGLSVCKKIVELHKGSIQLDSEPGKGSKFTFDLPSEN